MGAGLYRSAPILYYPGKNNKWQDSSNVSVIASWIQIQIVMIPLF